MKNLRYLALGVVLGSFSACQTAPYHGSGMGSGTGNAPNMASQTPQRTSHNSRSLAGAGSSLVSQFLDELASKTTLGSRDALDQAFVKMASENESQNIKSMDDLQKLGDADQKKLISEVLDNPSLEKNLGVSSDVAKQARLDTTNFSDVHGIKTSEVPDLKKSDASVSDTPSSGYFTKFVSANPDSRVDIQAMVDENNEIRAKIGVPVLNQNCDKLDRPDAGEALDDLELVVDGVRHDVNVGIVKTAQDLPADLEKEVSFVTGASKDEAHTRVRALADPKGECGIIFPAAAGL
jgi:hypothetical protein